MLSKTISQVTQKRSQRQLHWLGLSSARAFSSEIPSKMTVRESINSAMSDEIERDDNVFLIGEEVA